ncbi:MAG: ECF transporter S component [Lachnospiraceae bacterium]|nr:ECF transporter S component [Lachnospiraceae bacterium]
MKQTEKVTVTQTKEKTTALKSTGKMQIKELTFIALMGALSAVVMLFRFPLPFLPPFLSFDFAGVIEMIGGFMFGPLAAFLIIILKILLQLVMQGSFSLGTGELQSLILSCSYVMPAFIFYHVRKTRKSAAVGMAVGTLVVSVVAVFSNLYMIIPFYATLFNMTMDDIVAMCNAVNPAVQNALSMAILGIVPFNILKYGVSSVVTFLLYKRLSRPIKNFIQK